MPRKKKISELNEVNGKSLVDEAKAQKQNKSLAKEGKKTKPTSMAEIFGLPPSTYATTNIDDYEATLEKMNQIELQHECVRVGRTPRDGRDKNTELLLKVFTEYHVAREPITRKPVVLKMKPGVEKLLKTLQR